MIPITEPGKVAADPENGGAEAGKVAGEPERAADPEKFDTEYGKVGAESRKADDEPAKETVGSENDTTNLKKNSQK